MKSVLIYLMLISLFSVIITVYDKTASKHFKRNRVPEKVLFAAAIFGGSLPMYIAMQLIRHKTRHKSFMIGLPMIFLVQIIIIYFTFFAK